MEPTIGTKWNDTTRAGRTVRITDQGWGSVSYLPTNPGKPESTIPVHCGIASFLKRFTPINPSR